MKNTNSISPDKELAKGRLILEDGTQFNGYIFGLNAPAMGEVVFNTAMAGYPDILTDPSNAGQMVCITYPTIGNYGIPAPEVYAEGKGNEADKFPVLGNLESSKAYVRALIVCDYSEEYSHYKAVSSLGNWMKDQRITGICGIDTRYLTQILRDKGSMMGKIIPDSIKDSNKADSDVEENLVAKVSCTDIIEYSSPAKEKSGKMVAVVDCGVGNKLLKSILELGADVVRVPWNYDFNTVKADAVVIAGAPGNITLCKETIENTKKALAGKRPVMGIGAGNLIVGVAAGAQITPLKSGHRGHNQPITMPGGKKCWISTQNHGWAIDQQSIPNGWSVWFTNLNDGSVEGIRHNVRPMFGCQIAPEAASDTLFIVNDFIKSL